jgi:hypothetical protein
MAGEPRRPSRASIWLGRHAVAREFEGGLPMRRFVLILAFAAVTLALPASSSAQGYLVPNFGWDYGGSAGNCLSLLTDCQEKRMSYGVTFGAIGGIVGIEGDLAYAPDFFGESPTSGTNSLATLMGNLVLAFPAGPVRPFAEVGVGLIKTRVDMLLKPVEGNYSESQWGYNFGGGVMILLPAHLGFRGDVRYYRTFSDISILGVSLSTTGISYTRFSIGLVIH